MDFLKKKIGPMERITRCGILPLTYNNSLSYYETICALIYKVNEIIAYFDDITGFATVEYVDTAINGVLGTLNTVKEQLEAAIALKLDKTAFNEFVIEIQTSLNSIAGEISTLEHATQLNAAAIVATYNELKSYIDSQLIDIQVINPFTGETDTVQDVLNYMSNLLRTGALTAAEYDEAELTATDYDALDLTCVEYDNDGKTYILI